MNKYRNLLRRVAYLESLLYEGKQDQENLLKFLGQEYYDKYNLIKNKIKDPEYKDIYKLMKLDLDDVKDYIDDQNGYEGIVMTRFFADIIGKGIVIDWEDMI